MKTYRVKKDFVYKVGDDIRKLAGKTFRVDREVSHDEVDERACKGNPACFNFCMRRHDFTYEFDKKLYYGHIVDEEGYDLGYVMCEDELEEIEEKEMKKVRGLLMNKEFITRMIMFAIIIVFIFLFLTGCNKQIVDFDYTFDKAICVIGNETKEIELASWKDYDGEQLQLIDTDGNKYLVSSFNCTLIKEG